MATTQFTALSAQGQIVLPKALGAQLHLYTGDLKSLLDGAQEWADAVGMTEQDVQDAISDVRSAKKIDKESAT